MHCHYLGFVKLFLSLLTECGNPNRVYCAFVCKKKTKHVSELQIYLDDLEFSIEVITEQKIK